MARALRRALAAAGIAIVSMAATAPTSVAATAPVSAVGTVASVQPVNGQTVGVAHPIIVTFTRPVRDRAAAERSIQVTAPAPMSGRYEWRTDSTVEFQPDQYWPAHSQINLMAGGERRSFGTGATVLGVGSISEHTFTVSIDGVIMRQMPASFGKPRFATPVGSFSVLEKYKSIVMDSRTIGIPLEDPEGYKLTVANAVRVTWGGVYIHSAPWSVGSQGYANVSHGCVNLSPDNALWYFNQVGIGDPVVLNW
ncbi:L,D-transpeptidase [Mycolicibacterium sp.]|uniref:L,D-transpeptidase n=1 Tax=Mycolicibacterium sp. TaxID=2320850 RepID=UPI0028A9F4BE|nr:L,D-transpeptidase [Mycolicibacterium sp.]